MHHWVENIAPIKVTGGKGCRPRTLVGYRSYIRTWVDTSKVAKVRLDKLTPEHLEQLYKPMRDAKRSETTVSQLHRIISRALTVAVRRGRAGSNPAQRMDAPQPAAFDPDILTPDDARKLRVAAEAAPDGARWLVALALGLRQGETLASPGTRSTSTPARSTFTASSIRCRGNMAAPKQRPSPTTSGLVAAEPITASSGRTADGSSARPSRTRVNGRCPCPPSSSMSSDGTRKPRSGYGLRRATGGRVSCPRMARS
jgi:hypothetical protein